MADLPADRIIHHEPPFTSVGVDCFRRGRALIKRYGVIFTCLAIRAVNERLKNLVLIHGIVARSTESSAEKHQMDLQSSSDSHFGGVWERCIRTTWKILKALLGTQIIDDESLPTFP